MKRRLDVGVRVFAVERLDLDGEFTCLQDGLSLAVTGH